MAVTLDWSAFDSSIPRFLIYAAFDILRSMLRFDAYSLRGETIEGKIKSYQFKRLFDKIIKNFIYTKIMLPDGTVYQKEHGIPSGSQFTSLIGSIVNALVVNTLFRYYRINLDLMKFLGDDSHVRFKRTQEFKFDLDLLIKDSLKYFNLTLNKDKV